jgi:uncharacterized protein YjbI with pentapeptide repeats
MGAKWQKWWKSIVIGLVIIAVLALLLFIVINRNEPWTGFGEQQKSDSTLPAKTLWDWLDLFVVSFVVALALFWLNTSQKRREDKRETEREEKEAQRQLDNQRQATLLDYYDKMSKLIFEERLVRIAAKWQEIKAPEKAPVVVVARALTLSTFRNLDPGRNAAVLRFLGDAGLAGKIPRGTDMQGIDFTGSDLRLANLENAYLKWSNMCGTTLSGANLYRAHLFGAFLSEAFLDGADLSRANLSDAHLFKANLGDANLNGANLNLANLNEADLTWANLNDAGLIGTNLSEANLCEANLHGADLSGADLTDADLSGANLSGAKLPGANLRGAKYNDLTVWPDGLNPIDAGAILVDLSVGSIKDSKDARANLIELFGRPIMESDEEE